MDRERPPRPDVRIVSPAATLEPGVAPRRSRVCREAGSHPPFPAESQEEYARALSFHSRTRRQGRASRLVGAIETRRRLRAPAAQPDAATLWSCRSVRRLRWLRGSALYSCHGIGARFDQSAVDKMMFCSRYKVRRTTPAVVDRVRAARFETAARRRFERRWHAPQDSRERFGTIGMACKQRPRIGM